MKEADRYTRFTREIVDALSKSDYFEIPESPACIAIMPLVKPYYVGVEIGVFMGTSSRVFLEHCRFMYFIDPCKSYSESSDPDYFATAEDFRRVIEPYGKDRFMFLEEFSCDAAPHVPAVDFVFIDGSHKLEHVSQDIALYWPKVRSGGFLSGHDYNQEGVREAVDGFVVQNGLSVERHQYCWVIQKP